MILCNAILPTFLHNHSEESRSRDASYIPMDKPRDIYGCVVVNKYLAQRRFMKRLLVTRSRMQLPTSIDIRNNSET
jgi:hypothetical protein